jgi:hypothetical protein
MEIEPTLVTLLLVGSSEHADEETKHLLSSGQRPRITDFDCGNQPSSHHPPAQGKQVKVVKLLNRFRRATRKAKTAAQANCFG